MGSTLPVLSRREVVRVFESFGWEFARQSASHIILVKEGEIATLSVPDHREVAKGTLRSPYSHCWAYGKRIHFCTLRWLQSVTINT